VFVIFDGVWMRGVVESFVVNIRRYIYGWQMWLRAFCMARAKRHGAGRARLIHAIRAGACYRSIVDGQFRKRGVSSLSQVVAIGDRANHAAG
jgi:hypothetical protein